MKIQTPLLCGVALAMLSCTCAFASTDFSFSFTGNSTASGTPGVPFSGTGEFITNEVGTTNEYMVVGITGTEEGQTIGSLLALGGYGGNDNLLFYSGGNASATLDSDGISYKLADGTLANLFTSATYGGEEALYGFGSNGYVSEIQKSTISITAIPTTSATPEPSSFLLLGTGIVGIFGAARRRFRA